ncbi:MAG TPA: winged helix DNA-binding protein [Chitinophagaceae bacterium]|nr:winged helix DNA-binding protein [Chitinophagaceae bacterium]
MNKTIELVNKWGEFEEKHPDGSIEDFCRYLLIHQRESATGMPLVGGVVPNNTPGLLLKIMGRIHKMNAVYAAMALEGTGVSQLEEFGMLLSIQQHAEMKKTEIIYSNLFELSSGTDMLARMIKKGYIEEIPDKEDKRAKRLKITPAGDKVIDACKKRVSKAAAMMMLDVAEDDQMLCIKLLKGVEQKFSALLQHHKGTRFDKVFEAVAAGSRKPM